MLKSTERVTVPSLEQLINYNWEDYQGGADNSRCRASINYALSNFFVLYLQQEGLLLNVVEAFKNRRSFSADTLLPGPSDSKLIEIVFRSRR